MSRNDNEAEAAFSKLFDEYRQAVHSYFLGRTSDPELSRDLLQEVFLRVWRHLGSVCALAPERQRAWIFAAARNLTVDTYRARATRTAAYEPMARSDIAPPADDPAARAEDAERLATVEEAIRRLPEHLRTVLAMSAVGRLTSAQIGAALDEPPGTVRYELGRARRQLAEALNLSDEPQPAMDSRGGCDKTREM